MSDLPASPSGFVEALRHLGDGLLASAKDHFELLCVEAQEEKFRIIRILVMINAAIFCGFLALTFLSLTVVYLFWETARLAVLCSLTALYIAACVGIVVALKRFLAQQSAPFPATRQELAADRECIRPTT